MAYKNRKKKPLDLRKASLKTLKNHSAKSRAKKKKLDDEIAACKEKLHFAPRELTSIKLEVQGIDSEIEKLRAVRQPKKGLVASFLGLKELPPHIEDKIALLDARKAALQERRRELEYLSTRLSALQRTLTATLEWISKLEEAIDRAGRKSDTLAELRAAAASNSTKTRQIGASVKKKLDRQPWCPYCGGDLGQEPHADHIYPVSKGGRSTPKNMVYA